jgi:hypothetical protein
MTGAADHLLRIAAAVCVLSAVGMTYGVALKTLFAGVMP